MVVRSEAGTTAKVPVSAPPISGHAPAPVASSPGLSDGTQFVRLPRRVLYLQAILLAVVALLAFAAGYLIGSGTRLTGP